MSILSGITSRFTVTPLLYALGVCIIVIAAQGAWLWKRGVDVERADAAAKVATESLQTANNHLFELGKANKAWQATADELRGTLETMRVDAINAAVNNAAAIIAARKAQAAAEHKAKGYAATFAGKQPDCQHALVAMEKACPALSGY